MSYADKQDVENYLTIDIDTSFDSQVTTWANAVDRYIDRYTSKNFEETNKEVRYFDGSGESELWVDDFTSISSLEILEVGSTDIQKSLTQGKDNDYIIYPYNENPKYKIELTPEADLGALGEAGTFPSGDKRVKVEAKWGHDTEVPDDINLAATILLSGIIEEGLEGGKVVSESLGDYSVQYAQDKIDELSNVMGVKEILDKYKEFTV